MLNFQDVWQDILGEQKGAVINKINKNKKKKDIRMLFKNEGRCRLVIL